MAVWSENLGWRDVPFAAQASERCGLPTVLGPDVRAGTTLLDPLDARIPRHLTFQRVPRLLPAALGDRAGCMGAALLALDSVRGGA